MIGNRGVECNKFLCGEFTAPASGPWLDHGQPRFEHGYSWTATMVNHGLSMV